MTTVEQSNDSALAAAEAGDLASLERALRARAEAIRGLKRLAPSTQLAARMEEALQAGESISRALLALKLRLGFEGARLAQLESGLAAGLGFSRKSRVSLRG